MGRLPLVLVLTASVYGAVPAMSPGAVFGTRGLRTVALDVKLWGDGPKALRDELQPVLARLLREAGATVLVRGEPDFNTIKAQIVVDLKLYKSPDSSQCAWGIDVVLYDPVQLVRDPSIRPSRGYAYHNWRMGIAACPAVESVIRDNAVEFVEQFAKAFKHENSK